MLISLMAAKLANTAISSILSVLVFTHKIVKPYYLYMLERVIKEIILVRKHAGYNDTGPLSSNNNLNLLFGNTSFFDIATSETQ